MTKTLFYKSILNDEEKTTTNFERDSDKFRVNEIELCWWKRSNRRCYKDEDTQSNDVCDHPYRVSSQNVSLCYRKESV